MRLKYCFSFSILCFLILNGYSQVTTFTVSQIEKANTATTATQLTQLEKDVVLYINLVRMFPKQFFYRYADSVALEEEITTDHPNYISLKEKLLEDSKCEPLIFDNNLFNMAKELAIDIGEHGIDGHTDSKKQSYSKRAKKFNIMLEGGENIDFGNNDALAIVFSWLFDIDVESLGHRENLLNPIFSLIGLKFAKHTTYEFCCVVDLSEK